MVKKKTNLYIVVLLFLLTMIAFPSDAFADSHKQVVIDEAGLFTEKEISALEKQAEKYGEKRDLSYYIITIDDPGSGTVEDYTDNFYDEKIKTTDDEVDTIMLVIDMKNRKVDIGGFGRMVEYLNDQRVDMVHDAIGADLTDGNYVKAMETFLKTSYKYSGFKPQANPKNPFYNTFVQLIIAIVIGAGIVWMMVSNAGGKVTTNRRTYEDSKRSKVIRKRDRYIRTSVTKRRKPKKSSSSGGRRGGGGGRMTSGGSRRSGGSRGF